MAPVQIPAATEHPMATELTFAESLDELNVVVEDCRALEPVVTAAGKLLIQVLRDGGTIFSCGNGGSAADALHLAEELVGRYKLDRRPLPAICLNADVTALTCIANDYGYDEVFARQVAGLARAGDVLVGFSTSGNSPNVKRAFAAARQRGCTTIFLGGRGGGEICGSCDFEIVIPSDTTARIQELHTVVLHQWLEQIESEQWGK